MDYRLAIDKTILYSKYFSFPLTPKETHFWLISDQVISFQKLKKYIPDITSKDAKYRQKLTKNSNKKELLSNKLVDILRLIPGILMVAITGSVAIKNAKPNDDIDLLIITKPNQLWISRPIFLLFLSLFFSRRHPGDNPNKIKQSSFCPNLWLDTSDLSVPKSRRNIYTAHEVLQIKPIYDRHGTYQKFLLANSWSSKYLANAYQKTKSKKTQNNTKKSLDSKLIAPINYIFYALQFIYMYPKKTSERVNLHSAYFHKIDFSKSIQNYLSNSEVYNQKATRNH
jgi:predicted nucleotidyltransferase